MSAILEDLSPDAIVAAMEANFTDYSLLITKLPQAELHLDSGLTWVVSDVPERWFNGVLKTQLEPEHLEARIKSILAEFSRRALPMIWNITPNTRPTGLEVSLLAHGFRLDNAEPGLALDLHNMNEDNQPPPDFSVETIESFTALAEWTDVWMENVPDPTARHCREVYHTIGLGDRVTWRYYLGRLQGRAVATCQLFYSAGIVSVHHVATRSEAQRLGIGKALLVHALREARGRGYRVAVLTSTLAGLPLYRRIGFHPYATFSGYSFLPEPG